METGIIKVIDSTRGMGYVVDPEGHEILLITLGLEDKLTQGLTVHYNIRQTRVGVIAVDVEPVTQTQTHINPPSANAA